MQPRRGAVQNRVIGKTLNADFCLLQCGVRVSRLQQGLGPVAVQLGAIKPRGLRPRIGIGRALEITSLAQQLRQ